jgi:hypothetical protein
MKIYAKVQAEPGWRALLVDTTAQPGEKYGEPAYPVSETNVAFFALISLVDTGGGIFGLLASPMWVPLDAEGNHLKGALIEPGETIQEAIERIERPLKAKYEGEQKGKTT